MNLVVLLEIRKRRTALYNDLLLGDWHVVLRTWKSLGLFSFNMTTDIQIKLVTGLDLDIVRR